MHTRHLPPIALRCLALTAICIALWSSAPASGQALCPLPTDWPHAWVVTNVDIVDTASGELRQNGWVAVEGETITGVARQSGEPPPVGMQRIDGCGRTLVPGLADMHVHLDPDDLEDYLSAGVTTVRNLWGWPGLPALIDQLERRDLDGPTVFAMSPGLDGPPEYWPFTQLVMTPEQGREAVRKQVRAGWKTLKLYQDLSHDTYLAIVDEAKKSGLDYGGHVSRKVGIHLALASGHRFIEHLSGYGVALNPLGQGGAFAWRSIDESGFPDLIAATLKAGAWNSPTLAIFSLIAKGDPVVRQNRQRFVRALFDSGAPLLIGTDAGIGRTAPGASIHDEMQEFLDAGIPAPDVLRIATVEAARFLDQEGRFGQILQGSRADILFITGNPLEDLSLLRSPEAVVLRGRRIQ